MNLFRVLIFGLFFLFVAFPVKAENLLEVFALAQKEDTELRAAEANFRATLEAVPIARSAFLPQLTGEMDAAAVWRDPSGNNTLSGSTGSAALVMQQQLINSAGTTAITQATLRIQQAQLELDAAFQDLILRVSEAYFAVLVAQETLDFRRAEREAISRQLEQTQRRFEVGLIAITDVQEARAQFDLSSAQVIAAENALDLANEVLSVITNIRHGELSSLREGIIMPPPDPADPQHWVNLGLSENRTLRAQRLGTEIAREEMARQRAGSAPTLGMGASVKYTTSEGSRFSGPSSPDGTDAQIGLQLRIPLHTGGRVEAQTREARQRFEAAQEALQLAERRTIQNVRGAYLSVLANVSRAQALEQALTSTRAAFESAEAGFEVGIRTQVDVLLALREVYRAERDFVEARYDYLLDTLRLRRAAGALSVVDLDTINAMLH